MNFYKSYRSNRYDHHNDGLRPNAYSHGGGKPLPLDCAKARRQLDSLRNRVTPTGNKALADTLLEVLACVEGGDFHTARICLQRFVADGGRLARPFRKPHVDRLYRRLKLEASTM